MAAPTGPIALLNRTALRTFGRLPLPIRRFLVRTLTPSWTAGAVAVIARDDGRWLLVSPIYREGWTFPGGLLNRGESAEDAIHREMREELGIAIEVSDTPWVIHDAALRRLDTVFVARPQPGTDPDSIEICTAELDDLGWFERDSLPDLEDEGMDIVRLVEQVEAGQPRVLFR